MSIKNTKTPRPKTNALTAKEKRSQALKAALRENLYKRKAQARAKQSAKDTK